MIYQPTNISTKSDPETAKNGTPASPAMALARSVLPRRPRKREEEAKRRMRELFRAGYDERW